MKIETEFNKGDKVWHPTRNFKDVVEETIFAIEYTQQEVTYLFDFNTSEGFPERFVASTREALKAKLIDNINKLFEG